MSKLHKREEGFSLIELVLGMSVIITLTAGGSVGLLSINDGQRQEATELAARTVMTTAKEYVMDFDDFSVPEHAAAEWYEEFGQAPVEVSVVEAPDCIAVFATHKKGNEAEAMTGDGCADINLQKPVFAVPEMPERPAPVPKPLPTPEPAEPIEELPEPEEVPVDEETEAPTMPDFSEHLPLDVLILWKGETSEGSVSLLKAGEVVEQKDTIPGEGTQNIFFHHAYDAEFASEYFIKVESSAGTFEYPVNAFFSNKIGTNGTFISDMTITNGELEKRSIDHG